MRAIFLFFLLFLATLVAVFTKGPFSLSLFERSAPEISFKDKLRAVGASGGELQINLSDNGAGLDELVVRVSQSGKTATILKKSYLDHTEAVSEKITINGKELNLREGEATLEIVVFDKSYWSNKQTETVPLIVDYIRPQAEVLSVHHYGNQGGSLSVVYRHKSDDITKSGVLVKNSANETLEITGYPAALFNSTLTKEPNVYFSLFPLPQSFQPQQGKVEVFVEDKAGNRSIVTFFNKIQPRKFNEKDYSFPKDFFVKKVEDLLPKFFVESKQPTRAVASATSSNQDLIRDFRLVNEQYRSFLDQKMLTVTKNSEAKRYWKGAFQRPLAAAPTASFGEIRRYWIDGSAAGGSIHNGVDLAQSANAIVRPANAGKVVMAEDFGIYGNAVIIDHGFGLMTLYGHLSSILVNIGDIVDLTTTIGRTGETGLAGGDHLHFEVRLQGVPVTPIEWFDPKWIQDKIEGQFEMVGEVLEQR